MNNTLNREKLEAAMKVALKKLDDLSAKFTTDFPATCTRNGVYGHVENKAGWTTAFYTGMLMLAYQYTSDNKYLEAAKPLLETFVTRVDNRLGLENHDIGFNYTLSTVAAYMITGDQRYRQKSIDAANILSDRFREKGQFIQLAGNADCEDKTLYRLIIDCLMNINLLYWAGKETGDKEYTRKGFSHFNTTMECVVRDDGSTFQNFYFDPDTGARLGGGTKQGLNASTCWSRGQAWGVTGVPFTYSYMKNDDIIPKYCKIVDYYLANLPEDKIAYWDLCYTTGDEPRDSSASSISVCGLMEAVKIMPLDDEHKARYEAAANEILNALIDTCATEENDGVEGLIKHGTYYYAGNLGIDECCIWGDYFYLEALVRALKPDFKKYW